MDWRRCWGRRKERVRSWIVPGETHVTSATLLKELMFDLAMRMPSKAFEQLLQLVSPLIRREDTVMRDAINPRVMLEITLDYLATGNSFRRVGT